MEQPDQTTSRSPKAPEELAAQIAFHLTNALNPKGFVMVSRSSSAVVLSRRSGGLFIFGVVLVILGILAAAGGDPEALVLSLIGAPITYLRRPATVAVSLTRDPAGGTFVAIRGAGLPGVSRAINAAL